MKTTGGVQSDDGMKTTGGFQSNGGSKLVMRSNLMME